MSLWSGAQVIVETPAGPLSAPAKEGAYRLAAPWAQQTGSLDLIFTVTADDHTEILSGTLEVEPLRRKQRAQRMELSLACHCAGFKETLAPARHALDRSCWRLLPASARRCCCGEGKSPSFC